MTDSKKLEYTALVGLLLQGVFLLVCWVLGEQTGSSSVMAEKWHLAVGMPIWLLVLVHGRQRRLARQEREDMEALKQSRLSEELFEETELDTMRASASVAIFERYLVPLATIALSGGLIFFAFRVFVGALHGVFALKNPLVVAVGMVFIAFLGFLIGKYAAGLARSRELRLLRAAAGYVLGNVVACVLIAVAMAMYHFEATWGEKVVTYVIPVMMGLVGLELLLNMVLDIYRPRVPGQERRPPYDSRLLSLFAEPGGVLQTVASTLDYQFGFKVSETWFYRFMARAILPLFLIQLASLWVLTTVVVVDPQRVAFIEVLGKPYLSAADERAGLPATVFQPGYHLKWPWPFGTARFVPANEIQSVEVGKVHIKEVPAALRQWANLDSSIPTSKDPDVVLWREQHIRWQEGYEVNFLVPSSEVAGKAGEKAETPEAHAESEAQVAQLRELMQESTQKSPKVNLARVLAQVYFRVRHNPDGSVDERAAFNYCYDLSDPSKHLKDLAYRAVCRIAASQDFIRWIAEDRGACVAKFKTMLQEAIDKENLGLEIVYAGMSAVHPPPETARAYEQIVTALEHKESFVLEGGIKAAEMFYEASASAAQTVSAAKGYAEGVLKTEEASKDEFIVQLATYEKAPLVYLFRSYFESIEEALAGQTVFVVPEMQSEVNIIDMQAHLRPQLLDLDSTEK
ncbi:MAG: hypothetical protein J7M08_10095 [Planctomycetes bacterium]|nr:hypothetical protein [Planctomycetota bacterium]